MKKTIIFLTLFLFALLLVACNNSTNNNNGNGSGEGQETHVCQHVCPICGKCLDPNCTDPACKDKCAGHQQQGNDSDPVDEELFSYYQTTKLREDKKIYLLNKTGGSEVLTVDESVTAQAIQGLFARKEVTFYYDSRYVTNGVNGDLTYLEVATEKYGLDVEEITLEEAVEMYKEAWNQMVEDGIWGSTIPLTDYVNGQVSAYTEINPQGFATPGYIVYKPGDMSLNIALTLSGITGFLPVAKTDTAKYDALGLVEKMNVDDAALTYKWLFNTVSSELSTKGLIHQNYQQSGLTNKFLKDYGVCNKFFHVYYDEESAISQTFKKTLHKFLDPNSPILGYTYQEDSDVAFFSQYGQFIVPTDYSSNLTFFAAEEFAGQLFIQPNDDSDKKAENGKHYVAFIVSDGDNAQYWQYTAQFAANYMAASGRENDTFPVTWSMTPALADLMPIVLENVYSNTANAYDYFCAPVSGQGYINAGNFEAQNDGAYFEDFCDKLNDYMYKADLKVVTVIGGSSQNDLTSVLEGYASCSNVIGGVVYEGSKYFGNVRGGVIWIDGKPFVGPRDSLWETTPAYIAARINQYSKDPATIDGYTIVNVHPWSHSYDDIRTIVSMLDDSVEVVSIDRLFTMMSENITDKSNTTSFNVPEKNGVSITKEYLEQHPDLIPVDPLFNDFLLWEEDWSGTGVRYNSTDPACSNVGAMYKGNITISPNSTATKAEFTLPDIDNYWFSFNARCDSLDETTSATFKVEMTIDGVKKTVIDSATIKGVRGTETSLVYGEGWQCFAFPLNQFFEDYRGKTCKVEISVTSQNYGIRIDQVAFKERYVDPAISLEHVNPWHCDFYGSQTTEDWILGEQYKTSQYYSWAVVDHESQARLDYIDIDCSDGGGDEKRNANTNCWFGKCYTLPESNNISVTFRVSNRAYFKFAINIDGKYVVLKNWDEANGTFTLNLTELFAGQDISGKKATIIIEVRDSAQTMENGAPANGVGQIGNFYYFNTIAGE